MISQWIIGAAPFSDICVLHDSATTHDAVRSRKHRLAAFEDSGHIFCDQCGEAW